MSITKAAAEKQALSEIARCQQSGQERYTIQLYNHERSKWIELGKTGATAAREFEKRYILHRVQDLLKVS